MKPGPADRQVLKSDRMSNLVGGAILPDLWTKSITYDFDYEKCSFQL